MKNIFALFVVCLIANVTKGQGVSFAWAKQTEGVFEHTSELITTDDSGNVYIAGEFEDILDLNPGPGVYEVTSWAVTDIFIVKLDSNGNFKWGGRLGGVSDDDIEDLKVDGDGNIYTIGTFHDNADFDPGPNVFTLWATPTSSLSFICKLDPMGNFVWARSIEACYGMQLDIDAQNNLILGGSLRGTVDMDPGLPVHQLSSTVPTIFAAKYTANGDLIWAKQGEAITTPPNPRFDVWDTKVDAAGQIIISGGFEGAHDFDLGVGIDTMWNASVGYRAFILFMDSSGNYKWARQLEVNTSSFPLTNSVAPDNMGNIYCRVTFLKHLILVLVLVSITLRQAPATAIPTYVGWTRWVMWYGPG